MSTSSTAWASRVSITRRSTTVWSGVKVADSSKDLLVALTVPAGQGLFNDQLGDLGLRHRQERFDGSGPLGKKGSELPIEIWILILAEAFEEFRQANRGLDLERQFQCFFEEHSSGHHPTALEALGLLLVSSRLAELTAP